MINYNINKKGFTLIELIVVLVIIGILVLLAVPKFLNAIKMARYTQIINDIRVTEDVSIAHMVKNRELPKNKGLVDKEILISYVKEGNSYLKDGLIQLNNLENEEVEVGNVKVVSEDDLKGFYLLDKNFFVRSETKTRLKGFFLINKDGVSIYLDDKNDDWDIENPGLEPEPEDSESNYDGIFEFAESEMGGLIISGIKKDKEEEFKKLIQNDSNKLIIPKELKNKHGELKSVRCISSRAFSDLASKDFDAGIEILDLTRATDLERIGNYAFKGNKIRSIDLSNNYKMKEIGLYAFDMKEGYFVKEIKLPESNILVLNIAKISDKIVDIFGQCYHSSIRDIYNGRQGTYVRDNNKDIWTKKQYSPYN